MDNTLIRGDVNELQCILDFQKRGYYCSIPFSGSCRYDVIVDINNHLYRIQCKSSTYHEEDGTLRMSTTRSTTNTQKTIRYSYTSEEVDFFYTSWKDYGFLIPINEVSTSKYLRVDTPKKGVQETMSVAADYLLDNVILSVAENKEISRYIDNRFISWGEDGIEHLWTKEELMSNYSDRQIRYIKECIKDKKMAYQLNWRYKEFPKL